MMAYVHPDGNKPLTEPSNPSVCQFCLCCHCWELVTCPERHALSVVAGDIMSSPLWINPSGLLGQPTSKQLMMEYWGPLFQILGTRPIPGPGASIVPVTSRLDMQRYKGESRPEDANVSASRVIELVAP